MAPARARGGGGVLKGAVRVVLAHEDGVKQRLFCKLESKSWAVAAHWLLMLLKPAPACTAEAGFSSADVCKHSIASMAFGELRSKLPCKGEKQPELQHSCESVRCAIVFRPA